MTKLVPIALILCSYLAATVASAQQPTVHTANLPCKVDAEFSQRVRAEAIKAIQRRGIAIDAFEKYEIQVSSGKKCPDRRRLAYYYRVLDTLRMY